MADQKVDPNRPKDDSSRFATSNLPLATPATDDKNNPLPLGPETLEAQRAAFKQAESGAASSATDNPLDVQGVDADAQNAQQNPEASGPVGTDKEAVDENVKATQAAVEQQTEDVKTAAAPAPAPQPGQTSTDVGKPAQPAPSPGIPATSAQPPVAPPQPVKVDDPKQAAVEEGKQVLAGDPAQQHADQAVKADVSPGPNPPGAFLPKRDTTEEQQAANEEQAVTPVEIADPAVLEKQRDEFRKAEEGERKRQWNLHHHHDASATPTVSATPSTPTPIPAPVPNVVKSEMPEDLDTNAVPKTEDAPPKRKRGRPRKNPPKV